MRATTVVERLGRCLAVPPCRTTCRGWVPAPVERDDGWQPCECGHSRHVHAVGPAAEPLEPPEPARCACCGQLLPKENDVQAQH